jgi:hypothetical protein
MVDPSGLDGYVYMKNGDVIPFPNARDMWGFLKRKQPGEVRGCKIFGHANTSLQTFNQGSGPNTQGGLKWDKKANSLLWYFTGPNGDYVYKNMNELSDRGYEFIELHGCDTAGGHPRGEEMSEQYPVDSEWWGAYRSHAPSDDNLARRMTKTFPGTTVTGNAGPLPMSPSVNQDSEFTSAQPYLYVPGVGVIKF